MTAIMNRLNVQVTEVSLKVLAKKDGKRVKNANKRCQQDAIKRRKTDALAKYQERLTQEAAEEDTYGAGIAD